MKITKFSGIYPAVITPFNASGEVAEPELRNYLDRLVPEVDGLWLCGSYGSGPIMSSEQRRRVAEISSEIVGGRIPSVMHIGTPDTQTSIELARHSESVGMDAIAAVTPCYFRHSEASILSYYEAIVKSVKIPVFVYNNPKYSNFSVSGDLLSRLANLGIQGVKDSSGDIALFYEYMAKVTARDFLFLIGSQTHLVPAMVGGAHGCVSGLSNAFPKFVKAIYQLCREDRFLEAGILQKQANTLRKLTGDGIPIPFYHAVLPMLGIDIGVPRLPFLSLSPQRIEDIKSGLKEANMLQEWVRDSVDASESSGSGKSARTTSLPTPPNIAVHSMQPSSQ